jgi:hypothetical protein
MRAYDWTMMVPFMFCVRLLSQLFLTSDMRSTSVGLATELQ